jgi:hypothetical protein
VNQLYPAAIARLYCMELLGKKRPYLFDRRYVIAS